uniref:uncharacterized protein LOC120331407 isoform X2 n=1 Tax=Styela clava TaxID=7725 RepID=UPI00193A3F54|nr:uncharacterized protein LOC120331407 isoform X2 [Styela clava]
MEMTDGRLSIGGHGTKKLIRAVLLSSKTGILAHKFESDFKEITGLRLSYEELGFTTLHNFVLAIPDVILISNYCGEVNYHGVSSDSTLHLENLIKHQKAKKTKKKVTSYKGVIIKAPHKRSTVIRYGTAETRKRNVGIPYDIPNPLLDSPNRAPKDARPTINNRKDIFLTPRLVWHQTGRYRVQSNVREKHSPHNHSHLLPKIKSSLVSAGCNSLCKSISGSGFTSASRFKNPLMMVDSYENSESSSAVNTTSLSDKPGFVYSQRSQIQITSEVVESQNHKEHSFDSLKKIKSIKISSDTNNINDKPVQATKQELLSPKYKNISYLKNTSKFKNPLMVDSDDDLIVPSAATRFSSSLNTGLTEMKINKSPESCSTVMSGKHALKSNDNMEESHRDINNNKTDNIRVETPLFPKPTSDSESMNSDFKTFSNQSTRRKVFEKKLPSFATSNDLKMRKPGIFEEKVGTEIESPPKSLSVQNYMNVASESLSNKIDPFLRIESYKKFNPKSKQKHLKVRADMPENCATLSNIPKSGPEKVFPRKLHFEIDDKKDSVSHGSGDIKPPTVRSSSSSTVYNQDEDSDNGIKESKSSEDNTTPAKHVNFNRRKITFDLPSKF